MAAYLEETTFLGAGAGGPGVGDMVDLSGLIEPQFFGVVRIACYTNKPGGYAQLFTTDDAPIIGAPAELTIPIVQPYVLETYGTITSEPGDGVTHVFGGVAGMHVWVAWSSNAVEYQPLIDAGIWAAKNTWLMLSVQILTA